MEWLSEFFDLLADYQPCADASRPVVVERMLKGQVFATMFEPWAKERCAGGGDEDEVPSETYFLQVMREQFPGVRFTDKKRFTQCDVCAQLNDLIIQVLLCAPRACPTALSQGFTKAPVLKRKEAATLKAAHLSRIYKQRYGAHFWLQVALEFDDRFLFCCNDAMDTKKCDFPRRRRKAKGEAKLEATSVSILNYLSSHAPFNAYFVRPNSLRTTTNAHTYAEWLWLQMQMKEYEREQKAWPRTLIILEDNTSHDNKNNHRMQWLALLVHFGMGL